MDETQARVLLAGERARLQRLLQAQAGEPQMAVGLVSAGHPFEVLADADITPEEEQASEEDDDEPAPEPSLGIHIEPDHRSR
jgi:hypothetical protein